MRNLSLGHLAFGILVLVTYVILEARGVVFGGSDSRSPAWLSRSRSSSWGYSSGHFGGK